MSGLSARGICKSFGENEVLRGVDIEIAHGGFCSILGPSGSGKTTLLRVIAGFERADAGSVTLDGELLEDESLVLPSNRRRIGYVPQEGSLFPHLTVGGNVGFGLERKARRGPRVGELLEMVGLAGYERRYPHQLSGGQQQRVALARALAISPALVLLDEPFSSLDASLRRSVRQDVRRVLAESNTTALLVTHDQDEALSLSDRVAVIEDGRIGQLDTPVALYQNPLSPTLAAGLGDSNLLTGVASGAAVRTALGILPLEGQRFEAGSELVVLVRPEQIELGADGADAPIGRIVEREYYGHDAIIRLVGEWKDGVPIIVRLAASALPPVGQRVGLSVRGSVIAWMREGDEERASI